MDQRKLNEIWNAIYEEVVDNHVNKNKGSFKRALWYGGSGYWSSKLGDGKGLRKAVRNAPRKIGEGAVVTAATLPLYMLPPLVPAQQLVDKAIKTVIKKVIGGLVKEIEHKAISEGKKAAFGSGKHKLGQVNKSLADDERNFELLRHKVKYSIKAAEKEDLLLIIDRNLVKMKDASKKTEDAYQKYIKKTKSSFGNIVVNDDDQIEAADDLLRAVAETYYYINKIQGLAGVIKNTMEDVIDTLDKFNDLTLDNLGIIGEQIKNNIDDDDSPMSDRL